MDRVIKMPRGWRDDIDFMLEYGGIGPGEQIGLMEIRRGKHLRIGRVRWFVKLAVAWFADTADYRELLARLG